ncbi:glyoxalase/bleomycin resistance protein/dioxygenase [Rhodanobacter fulvus Jip2]|uniref:Glyoxalase/bleomycin resistance protein/dioxygenase n=1 Tax=Rhodanobacter fulvus Jip2 TaxID=1163408 RepID=I4VRZ0_9GAMM|nr:VOC family protein [Rhodanobacter fulvus]EIL89981.1 glyoxalase/bleomycin resistance protein/dioxygenase [Rhodanobacter fulvus Jip2]
MKYLHSMVRVRDLDASLRFYCEGLGLREVRRMEVPTGRYTLVFLSAAESPDAEVELTYNWDADEDYGSARNFGHLAFRVDDDYGSARNFGHLAFRVDDIYATCERLQSMGYTINRPPRDGHMAFVRSPDLISIELLQDGHLEPREPWASMPNTGVW